ncbi:hypothetical protein L7F22_014370 [Adiantum nelumboides]|nr:hypothetical protein [Adiantum nelumboides]
MSVPPRAKHMIGLKVKSEMKESSADVDRAKLEKDTLPTPTTIESGIDAIVDAMVVDACTYAIADATVVDACTNDIVDAMEVDASIDVAADGNVNDGGTESIVHAFIDAILDGVEAMGTDATIESGTNAIVDDMVVDACTDAIDDATIVDACTNDIVDAMEVDASTNATVEAMGIDAMAEDTRDMGAEVLIEREAGTREAVGASDVIAQAKVVCPSDAADDIVDAEETKDTDAVVEDMRGLGEEDLTKRVPRIGSSMGNGDVTAFFDKAETRDRAVQLGEAMGEAIVAATDMKEANTHNTIEACIKQNNEAVKGSEVPTNRAAQLGEPMGEEFMTVVDTKEEITHDTIESCTDPTVGNTKDKFWDLHLKATGYKKIDFEEQRQQFCAGLPEDMNDKMDLTSNVPLAIAPTQGAHPSLLDVSTSTREEDILPFLPVSNVRGANRLARAAGTLFKRQILESLDGLKAMCGKVEMTQLGTVQMLRSLTCSLQSEGGVVWRLRDEVVTANAKILENQMRLQEAIS